MTACEREREQIEALVDGELGSAERAEVEAHLATCAGCRKALADRRELAAAFAALQPQEPAPDFEARFWARIAREREAEGFFARLRALFSPLRVLALGAAAAAVLLFVNLPRAPEATAVASSEPAPEVVAEPPATLAARAAAPAVPAPDVRVLASEKDFELLQDDAVDAISELDVLEEWNDAGPS